MTQPTAGPQKRRLSTSMRAMLVTVPVVLIVVGLVISMSIASRPTQVVTSPSKPAVTVADNSHVLDDAGKDAPTLVEFLDFECEACGALYPYVEDVREYYDGKINYVVRYFPLGGHFNSMNAAVAVEAAAQQGKFEEMFHQMLQSQAEWGEQQTSEAARFRGYAEELGLDMSAYDKAVADPATEARVQQDLDAGTALGVNSTPTFFLDGKQLTLTDPNDLPNAIEAALDK
ncbi:DsbA family protein [Leucobacter sp. HY1910]